MSNSWIRLRAGAGAVAVLALLVTLPALAEDKYLIDESKPMNDARTPSPGKALIYFVRMDFGAVKVKLFGDGQTLGIVANKTYIPYECDPGKHEFIAHTEKAAFLEAEVEAGKIYYVEVSIHPGFAKARTHFEVAKTGSESLEDLIGTHSKLRAVTTTDAGAKWLKEEAKDVDHDVQRGRETRDEVAVLIPSDGFEAPPWAPAR